MFSHLTSDRQWYKMVNSFRVFIFTCQIVSDSLTFGCIENLEISEIDIHAVRIGIVLKKYEQRTRTNYIIELISIYFTYLIYDCPRCNW